MNIFVRLKGKTAGNLTWHYDSKLHVFAIKSIFVVKNCRQQGIGNKLMLKALEKAEEFNTRDLNVCIILEVDKGFKDFKLVKWFKKFHFKKGYRFKKMRIMYRYL